MSPNRLKNSCASDFAVSGKQGQSLDQGSGSDDAIRPKKGPEFVISERHHFPPFFSTTSGTTLIGLNSVLSVGLAQVAV
jgi:hypothetical protein